MKNKIKVLRLEDAVNIAIDLLRDHEYGYSMDDLVVEAESFVERVSFEIEFEQSKRDNVEAKEKQFEVTIYYIDGECGGCRTAFLTEDELEALLSGESKRYIPCDIGDEDEDRKFYLNPRYIVEVWVERELIRISHD